MRRHNADPSAMLLPSINQKDHIEFVIPSTKPPNWNGSASRSLYCQSSTKSFSTESNPTDQQKSYSSQQNPKNYPENLAEETGSVVNKGWNFISSAFTASSNFKTIGSKFENSQQRARSRDSLFPANHNSLQGSLDIPSIKTSESMEDCPIQILVDDEYNDSTADSRDRSASLVVTTSSVGLPNIQSATPGQTPDYSVANSRRGSSQTIAGFAPQERRRSRASSRGSVFDLLNTPTNCTLSVSAPGSRRGSKPSISIEQEPDPESYAQFGGINPSLYLNPEQFDKEEDFPENHLGRVYYNIYYDEIDEAFNVYIQRIRNLPKSTAQAGKTNKTYIKVCLLPDERSERKCTQQGDAFADLNPTFSENVVFQVSPQNLWGRILRILVYNIDVNRKHRILGQTLLDLADVDFFQGKLNLTADLQTFVNINDLPELLLSVCYNANLLRLTVNVVEGKNFKSQTSDSAPDTYVKLALMSQAKEVKRKKTETSKKSNNPAFQESFNFKVENKDDIDTLGVRVTAMQHVPFPEKDKALGFTVLGGTMFARGTGKDHWDEVMKNQKTHIQKWHKLRELVGTQNSLDLPKPGNRSRRGSSSTLNIPGTLGGATRQRSASVCSLISKK